MHTHYIRKLYILDNQTGFSDSWNKRLIVTYDTLCDIWYTMCPWLCGILCTSQFQCESWKWSHWSVTSRCCSRQLNTKCNTNRPNWLECKEVYDTGSDTDSYIILDLTQIQSFPYYTSIAGWNKCWTRFCKWSLGGNILLKLKQFECLNMRNLQPALSQGPVKNYLLWCSILVGGGGQNCLFRWHSSGICKRNIRIS